MSINSKSTNYEWAKDIPCKNITIYGYCKHEDKCAFSHDVSSENNDKNNGQLRAQQQLPQPSQPQKADTPVISASKLASVPIFTPSSSSSTSTRPPTNSTIDSGMPSDILALSGLTVDSKTLPSLTDKKKFNFDSPSFTPTSTKFSSPKVSTSATFVPADSTQSSAMPLTGMLQTLQQKFNTDTPSFSPSFAAALPQVQTPHISQQPPLLQLQPLQQQLPNNDMYYQQHVAATALAAASSSAYPLQYHLYSPLPPPHFQLPLALYERDASNLFIPNDLRESLQRKNEAANQVLTLSNLPDHINHYHSLVPIDNSYEVNSKVFANRTYLYKVQSSMDGELYCLRRIVLDSPIVEQSITTTKKWAKVDCGNVIKPLEAFTNMSFNDNSLFLVYNYFPCSLTLIESHFQPIAGNKPIVITEALLWSYVVQLTNAILTVHAKNLAVRTLDMSKIILTGQNRIRLSGCGVLDILDYSDMGTDDIKNLQKADLLKFGELMVSISSTMMPPHSRTTVLAKEDMIAILPVSDDFKLILKHLVSENANLSQLQSLLAPQLLKAVDGLQNSTDFIEYQLKRELENGRLFRLITKLNFIVERPEFLQDESWSETGERYPIKLFRDYVFHQYNELGKPLLDLNHVLSCLNKLDAGIEEKLLLVSSDEKSCLIVSYKDLKDLIESSFRELNR